jgi:hypothetical protein
MSITRPPTLTPEEMELLMQRIANSGAKITMLDPRVTSAQTWLLSVIGVAMTGFLGWNIKSIQDLNQTVKVVQTQYEFMLKAADRTEGRIDQINDRINSSSGKVERVELHIESVDGRVTTLERSRNR